MECLIDESAKHSSEDIEKGEGLGIDEGLLQEESSVKETAAVIAVASLVKCKIVKVKVGEIGVWGQNMVGCSGFVTEKGDKYSGGCVAKCHSKSRKIINQARLKEHEALVVGSGLWGGLRHAITVGDDGVVGDAGGEDTGVNEAEDLEEAIKEPWGLVDAVSGE